MKTKWKNVINSSSTNGVPHICVTTLITEESPVLQTYLVLFKIRDARVCVYGDVAGGKDLGVDGSTLSICLVGMLDDVYLQRKLSTTHNVQGGWLSLTPCANTSVYIKENILYRIRKILAQWLWSRNLILTFIKGMSCTVTPTNVQHV